MSSGILFFKASKTISFMIFFDAVKSAFQLKPDLCVSGINHGSNSSINVIYSGTMSAAVEAGIEGVPAIGFSLLDFNWHADFTASKKIIKEIV